MRLYSKLCVVGHRRAMSFVYEGIKETSYNVVVAPVYTSAEQ